jgi:hypothetical protein
MQRGADTVNAARRHVEQRVDQAWALTAHRLARRRAVPAWDGDPRFALVTVNASTTRYLKLMLLTLGEQEGVAELVHRIVVVDNGSRDGGRAFARALADRVPTVVAVQDHLWCNHARGMRAGLRALDRAERHLPPGDRANLVLFCDPDVVFRDPGALVGLAGAIVAHDAAVAGEVRGHGANPDIQASFLTVRRDVLARRDVRPPVNHGSPTFWLQGDVVRAGLTVVQFPSNHGGNVLHRGRSAVAATRAHTPWRSYATAPTRTAHFMGVPDGARIWDAIEARYADLLTPDAQARLLDRLATDLGTVPP